MAINLDETGIEEDTGISLEIEDPKISPAEVDTKAAKYDFVMGENSPGIPSITAGLINGSEEFYKDSLRRQKAAKFAETKSEMIKELIASKGGAPLDPAEFDFIQGMTDTDFESVASSAYPLETEYGKKFTSTVLAKDERSAMLKTTRWEPEVANQIADQYEDIIIKAEVSKSLLAEVDKRIGDASIFGNTSDFISNLIDPLAAFDLDAVLDGKAVGSILPGNSMREQINYLATLPPARYEAELTAAMEELSASNNMDARQFLQATVRYSATDEMLDNLDGMFGSADAIVTGLGILQGAKAGAKALKLGMETDALRGVLRGATRATSRTGPPDVQRIAEETGNFGMASVMDVVRNKMDQLGKGVRAVRGGADVERKLTSLASPKSLIEGRNLAARSQEMLNGLINKMETRNATVARMFSLDQVQVTGMNRVAATAQRIYDDLIKDRLHPLQNAILDVAVGNPAGQKYRIAQTDLTNTERIEVALGKTDGSLFDSPQQAIDALERYGLDGGRVMRHGSGYYAQVYRDIPENLDIYRSVDLQADERTKKSWVNTILGGLRSSKGVLSPSNSIARTQVVHGQQRFAQLYSELAQPIANLPKDQLNELTAVWKSNRDDLVPVYPDKADSQLQRGQWFTLDQLDAYFVERFGHTPTEAQVDAYFSYVQLNDADYLVRAASWFKAKVSFDIKTITAAGVAHIDPETGIPSGKMIPLEFEGKIVNKGDIAFSKDKPVTVAVYDEALKNYITYRTDSDGDFTALHNVMADETKANWRMLQVANSNLRIPNRDGTNVGVGFVLSPQGEATNIKLPNIHKAGGHVVQRYDFYLKQGKVQEDRYGKALVGDVAIFGVPTGKFGKKQADALNQARLMIKAGRQVHEIDAIVGRTLGLTGAEVKKMFEPQIDFATGEILKEGLSLDIPIVLTRQGQRTTDLMKYDGITDVTQSEYNLMNTMNRKFAGERDNENLWTMQEEQDVLSVNREGDVLDPIETLRHAAKNMVDLRFKQDYLTKSANDWVKEFGHVLDIPEAKLHANPMAALYNPTFKTAADPSTLRMAKLARKHMLRFLGTKTDTETTFEVLKQKMRDTAYEKYGGKGLDVVDNWLIPVVQDPLTFMRTVAFHTKLGLFNPNQFLVQGQAVAAVASLSSQGFSGMSAYTPMRMAMLNPNQIGTAGKLAAKMGWKEDEFLEMFEAFDNSGWGIIKGSTGLLDDIQNPSVIKNKFGQTLEMGTVFFDEGEKLSRLMSYASAYKEWKVANKGKQLDRAGRAWVLNRADDLTMNMSAAHQALWQRGPLGIPLQFFSYQARLTEAMLGKNLTAKEKMRLFAMQSAMYGIPTAVGGTIGLWPVYDTVDSELTSRQIPRDSFAVKAVVNGIPAAIAQYLGADIEYGPRFGSGGMPTIRDWANGNKSLEEIIVGASGTIVGDIASSTFPAIGGLAGLVTGNKEMLGYTPDDVIAATRNISSVNTGLRMWTAMNTGKWLTKEGVYVDDVTLGEALYMGVTGDSISRINQSYNKIELLNNRKEHVEEIQAEIRKVFQRSAGERDVKTYLENMRKIEALAIAGGLSIKEKEQAIKQGIQGLTETQLETVDRNFREIYLMNKPKDTQ